MSIVRGSELLRHDALMMRGIIVNSLTCSVLSIAVWLICYREDLIAFFTDSRWEVYWTYWVARGYIAVGITWGALNIPNSDCAGRCAVTKIVASHSVAEVREEVTTILEQIAMQCMTVAIIGVAVWLCAAWVHGHFNARDKTVAGVGTRSKGLFCAQQLLSLWLWSAYSVAGVRLPKAGETLGMVIVGTVGSGKTTIIMDILDQIRGQGAPAVVYDPDGTFISKYYREGRDVILNPVDARMPTWNPWADCLKPQHYDDLATCLMAREPGDNGDSIWDVGAAQFISSALEALRRDGKCSNADLYEFLATLPLEEVEQRLQGLPASVVMNTAIERTALSVRFTTMKRAAAFRYVPDAGQDAFFSIRKFIADPGDRWLFISAPADMRAMLRPLITVWLHLATTALLSLSPSTTRRVWFVIDEAASLNRLPALSLLMQECRRFGGCVVLGLQSAFQLHANYGDAEAKTLLGLPQTTLALRTPDYDTAELLAKRLGERVIIEAKESVQYGGHPARDGASLSPQYTKRYLVEPAELQCLPDRTGYLQLPGPLPVIRVTIPICIRPNIAEPFVPREFPESVHQAPSKPTDSEEHKKAKQQKSAKKEKGVKSDLSGLARDLSEPGGLPLC